MERSCKLSGETLTVRESAQRLGCTLKYIYDLLYSGRLAGIKIGKKWRIPVEAIQAWLNTHR